MDAYSKKILSMKQSNTLDRHFCIDTAQEAVKRYGYPEIIHADRGKQFLSRDFLDVLKENQRQALGRKVLGTERLHQALGYRIPDEVHYQKEALTKNDKIVVQL